jgi:hypothetical protein
MNFILKKSDKIIDAVQNEQINRPKFFMQLRGIATEKYENKRQELLPQQEKHHTENQAHFSFFTFF